MPATPQSLVLEWEGRTAEVRLDRATDCSLRFTDAPWGGRAWYVSPMARTPVRWDEWVGSVELGGSVNFMDLTLNPHGQGTHTECLGHVTRERVDLSVAEQPGWVLMLLATLEPQQQPNGDHTVEPFALRAALEAAGGAHWASQNPAVALRTGAADREARLQRQHSRANSPYWNPLAMEVLVANGIDWLLVEEPSVDREEDGGALAAHRVFWGLEPGETEVDRAQRPQALLTELAFFPEHCPDGWYALNLQLAPLANDAVPSRPVIYPLNWI